MHFARQDTKVAGMTREKADTLACDPVLLQVICHATEGAAGQSRPFIDDCEAID
jgi:hypothetical protein